MMSKALTAALYAVAASSSTASSSSESKKESTTSGKSALKTLNLNQASTLADVELTSTCSPPTKLGGVGYCGPDFCELSEKWSCTGSGKCAVCSYTRGVNQMGQTFNKLIPFNYQARLSIIRSRKCIQSKDSRCSSEYLKSIISGSGIKAAYCNDKFLIVHTDLSAGYPNWISDIPNPPGGGEDHDRTDQTETGIFCQTGAESMYEEYGVYKFPLTTTQLPGDDYTNNLNLNAFPNGCHRNNPGSHMCERAGSGHDYGHPVRGPIGITITGQEIFPLYNNVGYLAPEKCEIDTCNQHIGAGGGQTHIHGDPFGAWCMYDVDNYTSAAHHPPQIGWIFDGHGTFGRYIDTSSLGFNVPLDGCGGHDHDDIGYHYHAAINEAVTDGGRYNPPSPTYDDFIQAGMPYLFTTPGPYVCLKGDISLIPNYWANWRGEQKVASYINLVPDPTMDLCMGSANWYTKPGYTLPIVKSMEEYEAHRLTLTDEELALVASSDAYDQSLLEYAAEIGRPVIALEDWEKTTDTYDGDDKMTLDQALKRAQVPVIASKASSASTTTMSATLMKSSSKKDADEDEDEDKSSKKSSKSSKSSKSDKKSSKKSSKKSDK